MTQNATSGRLVLDGALTMRTAETVRATLRAAIETPSDNVPGGISIDCGGAGEIDLTFVQLLIAARASGQLLGKSVSLAAAPDGGLLDTLIRGGFRVIAEDGAPETRPGDTTGFWFAGAAS